MSVTHVFFDAGNTLVYVNMARVSAALARRGVRLTAAELWRGEHRARRALDTPDLVRRTDDASRWPIYFGALLRECGVDRPGLVAPVLEELRLYHEEHNLWEVVPVEVRVALDALRRRYRLSVISNSNGTVRAKLQRVGLAPYFDVIVDSREEGMEKPDPRLFRRALERAGASPARSLHVGDLYHVDVLGARAAGMHAALLDPARLHDDKPVRRLQSLQDILASPP